MKLLDLEISLGNDGIELLINVVMLLAKIASKVRLVYARGS